jgi:hypothetical protein
MQDAIRRVLNEDLFDLQRGDIEDEGPRFLVHYQVVGTGTFYTLDEQDDVPLEQRDVYAGIGLLFDVSTQVPGSAYPPNPDPTQGYRFRAEAWPAANFQVMHYGQFTGESSFGAAESVYDKMVDTAFQQFATQLALAYGLELSPR